MDSPASIVFNAYLLAQSGYGAAARAYAEALRETTFQISTVDRDPTHPRSGKARSSSLAPVLILCHVEVRELSTLLPLRKRLVVLTTWETDSLPRSHVSLLNSIREVWVPSWFNKRTFEQALDVPVFRLPHPARTRPSIPRTRTVRALLCIPIEAFLFASVATWQTRKNLNGVIVAFLRAYRRGDNAVLVIKTRFAFADKDSAIRHVHHLVSMWHPEGLSDLHSRIIIIDDEWPEQQVLHLIQEADCYLSLHRGEGWCYPLFDAACYGIPVIATAYSGPMDYLANSPHGLVSFRTIPVTTDEGSHSFQFTDAMSWADPDLEHASCLIRETIDHMQHKKQQALAWAVKLSAEYSPSAVGQLANARLVHLLDSPTNSS